MKVFELIEALQKFDKDSAVAIDDADTDWLLNITSIREKKGVVSIHGEYTDLIDDV
jgi:hypothetical protein